MHMPDQHMNARPHRRRWTVPLFLLIAILLAACGGLGGEPAIVSTIPPSTPTAPLSDLPAEIAPGDPPVRAPDVNRGVAIYAENCVQCHGPDGAGDGELVQTGQVIQPASFLNSSHVRAQTPFDYYTIITNGVLESLMPPWENALTEAERWDVAMYVYTLHHDPAALDQGEMIYAQECADCHGVEGRGDGPDYTEGIRGNWDLTDLEYLAGLSDDAMFTIISEGAGEMPAFADELSEDERWAVTDYTRTLALTTSDDIPADETLTQVDPTETAAAAVTDQPVDGIIRGIVTQGTESGMLPVEIEVTLHIFDMQLNEQTITTTADDSGTFVFEEVPVQAERAYFASTEYAGRSFASPPVQIDPAAPEADLEIVIYEVTNDPDVIQIVGIVAQIIPGGNTLEVLEIYRFNNTSDRLYSSSELVRDDQFASVDITLPVGAVVVGVEDERRFVIGQEDFTLTDTRAVLPGGDHFVRVSYLLPYNNGAVVEYPVSYHLNGPVRVLLPPDTLNVRSDQFTTIGMENIGPHTYMVSGGSLDLTPGEVIRYELSGRASTAAASSGVVTGNDLLPVLLIGLGLVIVIVAGLIIMNQRRRRDDSSQQDRLIDGLVKQIAELDSDHDAGRINHDLYRQRRAQLKARLAELIDIPREGDAE